MMENAEFVPFAAPIWAWTSFPYYTGLFLRGKDVIQMTPELYSSEFSTITHQSLRASTDVFNKHVHINLAILPLFN